MHVNFTLTGDDFAHRQRHAVGFNGLLEVRTGVLGQARSCVACMLDRHRHLSWAVQIIHSWLPVTELARLYAGEPFIALAMYIRAALIYIDIARPHQMAGGV